MIEHVLVHTPNKFFGACTEWGSGFDSSEIPNFILGSWSHKTFQRLCIKHQPTMIYCHSSTETSYLSILLLFILLLSSSSSSSSWSSSSSSWSSTRSNNMSTAGVQLYMPILSSTKCNRRCFRYSLTKDLSLAIRLGWSGMKTYCWWKKSG